MRYPTMILLAATALGSPAAARLTDMERASLARDVDRVESVRAVKDVQRLYAQFSQFGRWRQMADLFASDGVLDWGGQQVKGVPAIAAFLRRRAGEMTGAVPRTLHTEIIDEPLVNLSVDGESAKVRWMGMRFLGDGKGHARIEGGLYENVYVREGGRWRIATLGWHPQYEGDYASGWSNVGGRDLPIIPTHFSVDESGTPIPPATGPAPATTLKDDDLAARIARLNDEDAIRNAQNAYGYYVDRRMWTDAIDLFAEGGTIAVAGTRATSARAALEAMGPEGLSTGDLNERLIFDLMVTVDPHGRTARARGIELGLLATGRTKQGAWEFSVFESRFVKDGGLWKLAALNRTPLVHADYASGWGDGGTLATTRTMPPMLVAAPARPPAAVGDASDLRRRLQRSAAYDGVENVSSAYGFYIDDFQWPQMAGIFAKKGNKQAPFAGYYLGRDRILGAVNASWGPAPKTRSAISFHWRTQPVIHVSHDGRSANLRTRLFQPRTSKSAVETPASFYMGGLHGGMYPNDQAVLENGIWRLWSLTIDEHYFASPNWKGGWAAVAPNETAVRPSPLLTKYPPDVKISDLGRREEGFRGGTGTPIDWPGILPMWFHYRNPVSGRTPDRFWPDCVPCEAVPAAKMTAYGYQQPPTGPEADGIETPPPRR